MYPTRVRTAHRLQNALASSNICARGEKHVAMTALDRNKPGELRGQVTLSNTSMCMCAHLDEKPLPPTRPPLRAASAMPGDDTNCTTSVWK